MDDVLPLIGGYLVVTINEAGYILYDSGIVIHRETRDLHLLPECHSRFSDAKGAVDPTVLHESWHDQVAVLELTPDGGGAVLWMREDQVPELSTRRNKFKGCYGEWPIRVFSKGKEILKMKEYTVEVPEVWYQSVSIEANSEEEAKKLVMSGEGTILDSSLEYSHTLDPREANWYVEES